MKCKKFKNDKKNMAIMLTDYLEQCIDLLQ